LRRSRPAEPAHAAHRRAVGVRDAPEIERAIAAFAQQPNGGMLVTASALAFVHRGLLIELAERHKLPAVYPTKLFARTGGLLAYGPDNADQYRRGETAVSRRRRAVIE
jgi:putative ABC transport system substrate-binding protein